MKRESCKFILISVLTVLILNGCNSFVDPGKSAYLAPATPVIEKRSRAATDQAPTKAKFLSAQDPDIQKAYASYEKTGRAPIIETQDFLQFPFGETQPVINCQPIRTCDVELESGERITGIYPGDTARWKYELATSGLADQAQPHVIFKPTDYDIATNVIITTTKRTYHLGLVSKQDNYVRQVKFWYPEDMQAQWNQIAQAEQAKAEQQKQTEISKLPNIDASKLDFNYSIGKPFLASSPAWMPVRAFNDGTHVYIQMPDSMRTSDAPALFVMNNDGQNALVNYRVRGNFYIVDLLFKQAVLVTGVGSSQQRVTITYNG